MQTDLNTEFQNRLRLMAVQLRHLNDGRFYKIQTREEITQPWQDLALVESTALCDYCTDWLRTRGVSRVRAMSAKAPEKLTPERSP